MKQLTGLMRGLSLAAVLFTGQALRAATNEVGGYLHGTVNWRATNTYVLTNYTYVMSNAVLNIEPGTVIKGRNGTAPNFGSLFVTRGARIYAIGTKDRPIIFTAEIDDVNDPNDMPLTGYAPTGGRQWWGGLVILGNALINNSVSGSATEPRYDVYEGLNDTDVAGEKIHRFGGTNDVDNSGVLRYVSIRHGGKVLESAKEINGLSLGAVGSGTTIDYVEAFCIADDGFEFFGGSVNTKHLVSAFNDDDAFDTDQGYHGKNQFWFALQQTDAVDEGSEQNGQPNSPTPVIAGAAPLATYEVYNATFIGAGTTAGNDVLNIRVQNFCKWYNGVFTAFAGKNVNIDGTSQPDIRDNLFFNITGGNGTGYGTAFMPAADNPTTTDPQLRGISRAQDNGLDPRPQTGSPALNSARTAPNDGFYSPVAFKGAFAGDLWIDGWTALSKNGILPVIAPTIGAQPMSGSTSAGGSVTLTVQASGTGLTYQWFRNGAAIFDANDSSYVIGTVDASTAGAYTVVVQNSTGQTVASSVAVVTATDIAMYAGIAIVGPVGQQYQVQYTTSLNEPITWTPLDTVTLTSSAMNYVDVTVTANSQPKRFYRAVPIIP